MTFKRHRKSVATIVPSAASVGKGQSAYCCLPPTPCAHYFVQHEETELPFDSDSWQLFESWMHSPQIFFIRKTHANAFYQTNLNDLLTEQAVQTLEIASVQTEFCVDTTIPDGSWFRLYVFDDTETTSTLDNGHLTAAQIIQHHEAIWAGRF